MAFWAKRARDCFSPSSASRHRVSIACDVRPEIERQLPMALGLFRSRTAFIRAPVTAPRSSGSGTVTPVAFRMASALRRITSSTAPSIALSGE